MCELSKSEVFFDLVSQMPSLGKICVMDWLRLTIAAGAHADNECHKDEEPVEADENSQRGSKTIGIDEQLMSFTIVFVNLVGN